MPKGRVGFRKRLDSLRIATLAGIPQVRPQTQDTALVYLEHGLLYNRIKKSGNSSIVFYLRDILSKTGEDSAGDYRHDKKSAVGAGRKLTELSVFELRRVRSVYAFTIFRNPYTRCLSAFLSKRQKWEAGSEKYKDVDGFEENSPEGFAAFVRFLEKGGLYHDKHFWPQVELLMCPPDYFARIGQLENLESELNSICRYAGVEVPAASISNQPHEADQAYEGKVTGANAKVRQYYSDALYDRVYRLYEQDFHIGGYDPAWRP